MTGKPKTWAGTLRFLYNGGGGGATHSSCLESVFLESKMSANIPYEIEFTFVIEDVLEELRIEWHDLNKEYQLAT